MNLTEAIETLALTTLTDLDMNGGEGDMQELKSYQIYLLGLLVSDFWNKYQDYVKYYSHPDTESSIVLYLGTDEENHTGDFRPQIAVYRFESGKPIPETFYTEVYRLSRRFIFTGDHKETDCFHFFLDQIVSIIKGYKKAELIKIIE